MIDFMTARTELLLTDCTGLRRLGHGERRAKTAALVNQYKHLSPSWNELQIQMLMGPNVSSNSAIDGSMVWIIQVHETLSMYGASSTKAAHKFIGY